MSRKRKMREELLAHVTAVFEEEHVQLGAEGVALERTKRRFGDPATLTCQLQEAVPQLEWLLGVTLLGNSRFFLRPGESRLRCALRQSLQVSLLLSSITLIASCLFGFVFYCLTWDIRKPAPGEIALVAAGAGIALIYMVVLTPVVILLAHGMWHALYEPAGSWFKIILVAVAASWIGPSLVCMVSGVDHFDGVGSSRSDMFRLVPGFALALPYILMFAANARWRFCYEPAGRSGLRTIGVHITWGFAAASLTCLVALVASGDFRSSLENALVPLMVLVFWLAPLDLIYSAPGVLARVHSDLEWSRLPIDE
jgi:hypothetical protein